MKILYVEDELSKNIDGIVSLFSEYLRNKQKKLLKALIEDKSGFRIDLKEIKSIVESTNIIEVEWRFPDALQKIIHRFNEYDLFIVDRNLSEQDYVYEEIKNIDDSYNKNLYETYFTREGDYFLHRLIYKVDVIKKFYFLTAYSSVDEIRDSENIKTLIDLGNFKNLNFIEKGNKNDIDRLKDAMKNSKTINLRSINRFYISILEKYLSEKTVEIFINVLQRKDDTKEVSNNLGSIRNIYQLILTECSERIPNMKNYCLNDYKDLILGSKTLKWLKEENHIDEARYRLFYSLQNIASKYGSHPGGILTIEAINAIIYQLKDMIVWFDDICKKYPK